MGRKSKAEKDETFYVEVIKAARVVAVDSDDEVEPPKKKRKKGKKDPSSSPNAVWEYYVKWYDYDELHDTWEPAGNLDSCKHLIRSFWEAVGIDDEDYQIGTELYAPDHWIEREAARFRKEHEKEKEQARKKKEERERQKREKEAAKKEKAKRDKEKRESSQLTTSTSSTKLHNSKKKRQRIESSDSDSSDSDVPLAKKPRPKQEDSPHIPPEATSKVGRDEPKQKKRKRAEESGEAAVSPARPAPAKEGRRSVDSLFSDDESPVQTRLENQHSYSSLVPPSPPPPVPVLVRAPAHGPVLAQAPTILAKPPPLPTRKSSNFAPVRMGNTQDPLTKLPSHTQHEAGPSSGGISTKARLALGALAPLQPKKMSSAIAHKPEPVKTGSSTMMVTNFRKGGVIPAAQHHPEPTLASLNAAPASPLMEPIVPLTDGPVVESPIALEPTDPFRDAPSVSMANQADEFLNSLMPPGMAGPLEPTPDAILELVPPPPLPSKATLSLPLSRKIFKWEGPLNVGFSSPGADSVESFPVVLENEVDKLQGLRFSFFFNSPGLQKIEVQHTYHVQEFASISSACSAPSHFAKVSLQQLAQNKNRWIIFLRFLNKSQQMILLPLTMDGNVAGHLFLAPPKVYQSAGIRIPTQIAQCTRPSDNLVACILPWTLTPKQRGEGWKARSRGRQAPTSEFAEKSDARFHRSLKSAPLFQTAMRALDFPMKTFDYLQLTSRHWMIQEPPDRGPKPMYEGKMLRSILSQLKEMAIHKQAKDPSQRGKVPVMREASKPDTAGVFFIHVGALRHLGKLPFMRERLISAEYVRFYTFGSHPTISKRFWGVREIYPCGGVVTFLPSAFMNYPLEMMEIIRNVNKHPLWTAYILPSVLGMVAKMSGAQGPDWGRWAFSYLLEAIEEGQLALIEAPPENKFCFGDPARDRRTRWIRDYFAASPLSREEIMSSATSAFSSVTANAPQNELSMAIEKEVAQDLARMQIQPTLMVDYRRYVALAGVPVSRQDSLEWVTPPKFTFRDSFLPK